MNPTVGITYFGNGYYHTTRTFISCYDGINALENGPWAKPLLGEEIIDKVLSKYYAN